jgi:imidazolonepropionase-like amidohydrolase
MKLRLSLLLALALLLSHLRLFAAEAPDLVLQGAKVYPSPTDQSIDNAVVLIHNGSIASLGPRNQLKLPKSARVIDCTGKVIVAGFWNSHVHFENGWQDVPHLPADKIEAHMQEIAQVAYTIREGKIIYSGSGMPR